MLLLWVGLTLCLALVSAQDRDVKETSAGPVQVRETRGLVKNRRQEAEEGEEEMADEPVEVVEEEQAKPKKKKTPEEIEEGK